MTTEWTQASEATCISDIRGPNGKAEVFHRPLEDVSQDFTAEARIALVREYIFLMSYKKAALFFILIKTILPGLKYIHSYLGTLSRDGQFSNKLPSSTTRKEKW